MSKIKEEYYVIGIKTHALDKKDSMENILNKAEVFGFNQFKQKIIDILRKTIKTKIKYFEIYGKVNELKPSYSNNLKEIKNIEDILGIDNSNLPKKEKHLIPILEKRRKYMILCFDFYLGNKTENERETKAYLRTEAPNNDYLELKANLRNLKEWQSTPLFKKENDEKIIEKINSLDDVLFLLGIK